MILATTQRAIGFVILAVVVIGTIVWLIANLRAAQDEVGSEIELAPNRKPYLPDEELEGSKLNLALFSAAGLLAIIGVALPLYWLGEPGRMEGAEKKFEKSFIRGGLNLYEEGAQCINCHGGNGSGGIATFIINDQNGNFVDEVSWISPALNDVLYRYDEDQVRYVLNFGRPGSPMAAWGTPGGGPLTEQQIDNLIAYMWSIQKSVDEMRDEVDDFVAQIDPDLADRMVAVRASNADAADPLTANRLSFEDELALGEILFNNQALSAGSYSCSRCHVAGASYGRAFEPFERLQMDAFGPDLTGVENEATPEQHFDLIWNGMTPGQGYFSRRQGNPQMPGFGVNRNTGREDEGVPDLGPEGQLTIEQVWAIVTWERNMSNDSTVKSPVAGTAQSPTFNGGR